MRTAEKGGEAAVLFVPLLLNLAENITLWSTHTQIVRHHAGSNAARMQLE